MGHAQRSWAVMLLIRPATPTGPVPATTSGQVPMKARSHSVFESRPSSPTAAQQRCCAAQGILTVSLT